MKRAAILGTGTLLVLSGFLMVGSADPQEVTSATEPVPPRG